MLESYRNGYTAVGLILGVSLTLNVLYWLSFGYDWIWLDQPSANTYTYAEQECATHNSTRGGTEAPVLNGDQTGTAKPGSEQSDQAKDGNPDWCDLAAQQSMAKSTVGMEQAAWVAIFLTVIGVSLVWRTLYFTRETLKEAQSATNAAISAVDVTELIGKDQMRAYVHFPSAKIVKNAIGDGFRVQIQIKNFGQTPARDVRKSEKIGVGDDIKDYVIVRDYESFEPATDIGPQQTVTVSFDIEADTVAKINGDDSGNTTAHWVGIVYYRDIYNRQFESAFAFKINKGEKIGVRDLHTCRAGNYGT